MDSDYPIDPRPNCKLTSANVCLDMDPLDSRPSSLDMNSQIPRLKVAQHLTNRNVFTKPENNIDCPFDPRTNRDYCTKKIILRKVSFDFSGEGNDKIDV